MSTKLSHTLSKIVLGCLALYFIYLFSNVVSIVNRRYIGTQNGTYINSTTQDDELYKLATTLSKNCSDDLCKVQRILDYITNIPYQINHFSAHSPHETLHKNFGDCDDKSNLLISLLHELHIPSYFVLVPEHIFVVVSLPKIPNKKALYINHKPYYILESTAKDSLVGFPLRYSLDEIEAIIEPFENRKVKIKSLEYK